MRLYWVENEFFNAVVGEEQVQEFREDHDVRPAMLNEFIEYADYVRSMVEPMPHRYLDYLQLN